MSCSAVSCSVGAAAAVGGPVVPVAAVVLVAAVAPMVPDPAAVLVAVGPGPKHSFHSR